MRVLVIGAGAAGLMAAGTAARLGADVVVLERNEKAGKKLYITGKGRCNLTNECQTDEFLQNVVTNPRFLYSALSRFSPKDTIEFFAERNMHTVTERGGRVFPKSGKASDVTRALTEYAVRNGAKFVFMRHVTRLYKNGEQFFALCANGDEYCADRVIVACGGKSYPQTGSDGSGYQLAAAFGHRIQTPRAALSALLTADDVSSLAGLSLKNVRASVVDSAGAVAASMFGEMLFTGEGVSGPIILSISSQINTLDVSKLALCVDLKPALDEKTLDARLLRDFSKGLNRELKNSLNELFPKSLAPFVIRQSGILPEKKLNSITKEQRQALVGAIKGLRLGIACIDSIEKGIVTAGGVDVAQIDSRSMHSRLVDGLFFAGEMLDVDALTGGFNIQIALSTGYVAGTAAAGEIKK